MKKIKVYVAGKLNDDAVGYIKNVHTMIKWADVIRRMGFYVFVPCLDLLSGLMFGDYEYKDYFENNQAFLECCDIVFVLPKSEESKGTHKEIELAKEKRKKVVYTLEEMMTLKDGFYFK